VQPNRPHPVTASRPDDRAAAWLSANEGVFTLAGPILPGPAPDYRIWPGSATLVSASSCQEAMLARLPRPIEGRLLDHLGLRLILSGMMRVGEGRDLRPAGPGDFVFIDLSQPLHLEYLGTDEATSELTLWVPRSNGAIGSPASGTPHGRVLRGDEPATAVVGAATRALRTELDRLSPGDIDQLVSPLFALGIARMLVASKIAASPPTGLESFATICRFIDANLVASDLGVERLARTFGLSRASLYRLFEPVGGVASYVRTRRLGRARQELLAAGLDNRRIGPIAYQSGFRSVAAFNRAFRELYGEAPRDARKNRFKPPASRPTDPTKIGILARALLAITG
jgi:AraC-like DNA-binding protein